MKRKRSIGEKLRGRRSAMPAGSRGDVRDFLRARNKARRSEARLPDGVEIENAAGRAFVRRTVYPLGHVHGDYELGRATGVSWDDIAVLAHDAGFADVDLGNCLFMDTETTGLAGGAGTAVFMIGMGFVQADELVVEQVFLRGFHDEPAALLHFAERLRTNPLLVTYVGKSFDRHRLAARMTIHRVEAPILAPLHLDLYYLARRRFGHELPNVRLQTVEREKLGVVRANDLPGSEAPRAFLDWLRDGTGEIERVFEHNRIDVLSLVTLLGALGTP